jgi:hypothetical protein
MPGNPTQPSLSVWTKLSSDGTQQYYIEFLLDDATTYVGIRYDSLNSTFDSYINGVKQEDGTTIITNPTEYFHIQIYLDIAASGTLAYKVNGHSQPTFSGDTRNGANTSATRVRFYQQGGYQRFYIDDLVLGEGGFLGDLRCVDIVPNADTAVDDWTPTSGDNYSTIDERPPSDVDYNETSSDGDADELDMTDYDGATYIPVAITSWVRARQDAGVGNSIYVGVDSGGTDDVSSPQPLSNDWEYYYHTLDSNPADAAEWEDADIDALKLRYQSRIP